ncbi:MAG: 50S ribosomal protein L4 [Candidatus Peribacteraceae bacterium]|nr:50S ribosomal protein L4 [Candidatus Peribacteraceae bacterium]MDD5074929.1 50S ribosomal protein L4 [Candidatus Peribacteraceae bacterium]
MIIDVYSATGTKKGTAELPAKLFEAPVNTGLLHQAVMLQQGNRRAAIAHAKTRSEVVGSTRKLYAQKGTGRARRGSIRSPLMRGGNKAFGPRNVANFSKEMPKSMRHAALFGSLSLQAKRGAILGLENYPSTIKTKEAFALLTKLPVEIGRHILIVLPGKHPALTLSTRNIPNVKAILAQYLNPEDVLRARTIIFLVDALKKAEDVFTVKHKKEKQPAVEDATEEKKKKQRKQKEQKSADATAKPKKTTRVSKAKKASSPSVSSDSSASSSK